MTKNKKSSKRYKLTPDEVKNIKGRELAIDFIQDLVKRDLGMLIQHEIFKRLDIKEFGEFTLSEDREWIEVSEPEGKIIVPNGKV